MNTHLLLMTHSSHNAEVGVTMHIRPQPVAAVQIFGHSFEHAASFCAHFGRQTQLKREM